MNNTLEDKAGTRNLNSKLEKLPSSKRVDLMPSLNKGKIALSKMKKRALTKKIQQHRSVEERKVEQDKPLAELTFYNPNSQKKIETPKIKLKSKDTSKNSKQLPNENSNIFSFTFNRHKFSTPSPGGTNKKRAQGIGPTASGFESKKPAISILQHEMKTGMSKSMKQKPSMPEKDNISTSPTSKHSQDETSKESITNRVKLGLNQQQLKRKKEDDEKKLQRVQMTSSQSPVRTVSQNLSFIKAQKRFEIVTKSSKQESRRNKKLGIHLVNQTNSRLSRHDPYFQSDDGMLPNPGRASSFNSQEVGQPTRFIINHKDSSIESETEDKPTLSSFMFANPESRLNIFKNHEVGNPAQNVISMKERLVNMRSVKETRTRNNYDDIQVASNSQFI